MFDACRQVGDKPFQNICKTAAFRRTYPLLEGEVWRRAPRVLAGQQSMGIPGAWRVGVGGGVGAGGAHGRRHVAVVVQHRAVAWVWGRGLRGGRVGPTQQRRGPPVHRFIWPRGAEAGVSYHLQSSRMSIRLCVCVCVLVTCCPSSWQEPEPSRSSGSAPGPHTPDGAEWRLRLSDPPPTNTTTM